MNKNAIKKFAIEARKKLIASVTDKAGMLGITPEHCSEAITKGADFEVYQTAAGTEVTLDKKQCEHRRKLVEQIRERGFDAVIEEVAYTWFNRICAIRFMEVNDYMYPVRVRVLSSEKEGKNEPDIVTMAPDIDWNLTEKEKEAIIDAKMNGRQDDLFRMLFIKQCNLLHEVLPGLFEETDDYTEMLLNISFTNKDDVIRMLVDEERGIPEEDFNVNSIGENGQPTGQVEIIGWLYQYYNTELKDDTFEKLKKNIKISKERIPAATQLFTPDWIVRYMVENSVGRIWIEHLCANDSTVDEKATAESFGWKYYLPEAEQEDTVNVKLAEIRTTYKDLKPEDITCIDPCMGSGHILIAMFDVLMDIYESAGYDRREAAFEIVEHNIHGLDIDKRAYQLAYFAVMMKGRGYNRRFFRGRDDVKPEPMVYAIVESNDIQKRHLQFFGASMVGADRKNALEQIEYILHTFVDAREYGSILNVENCDWELLECFVNDLDNQGQVSFESLGSEETQNKLKILVQITKNMSAKYDAVVTNPPYMGSSGMNAKLSDYVKKYYPDSKGDLFACCIEKGNNWIKVAGYNCMVTMQSWMFLSSFEKMRVKALNTRDITNLMHMENMVMGIAFGTAVTIFRNTRIKGYKGTYNQIKLCDVENNVPKSFPAKDNRFARVSTDNFSKIPGSPVAYWVGDSVIKAFQSSLLGNFGYPKQGFATGNNDIFLKLWHEVNIANVGFSMNDRDVANESRKKWFPCNKGGAFRKWYGNNNYLANWQFDGKEMTEFKGSVIRNSQFYFKQGISWSSLTSGKLSMRYSPKGFLFESKGSVCFLKNDGDLLYILGLMNTEIVSNMLLVLSPTLDYHEGPMSRVPVIMDRQQKNQIEQLVEENIKLCKDDWDFFETSWDFTKHPLIPNIQGVWDLEELEKKRVGEDVPPRMWISASYEAWEEQCNRRFNKLKANEEELNRIFIDIYGLQDELTPEVEDKDVTVRKADLGRDIRSFISYAVGCMFGRYSLDAEGLAYAGGEWDNSKYTSFIPDADNVIPITDEEYFSDDIASRFVDFVKTVYGQDTLEDNLDFIAQALGGKGDTSREVIRNYFVKDFYADHLKVYQKRPIYWLFDSGKQNGFKALIYMHRYDADTVGRVRTDYLHRAQKYVESAMQSAQYTIENASSSSDKSKATKAVTKYTKQLAEMKIYDEAIAHIANRRIEIDLDDGVKVNYAKFQGVEVAQEGKKALKVDLLAKI